MTTARVRLLLSVICGLVAMVAAWKLRTIPVTTDPWHYVLAGSTFPQMTWNSVGLTRYGMVLPMMAVTRVFHISEISFYLTPILATGALLGAVYWITSRLFGPLAGLTASILLMANSVFLVNATRMYPDVFCAAAVTIAIAFAIAARDSWEADSSRWRLIALLVACGMFVGLSWWMRETAVFTWPAVALPLLWRGRPPLKLSLPIVGGIALGWLVAEMVISSVAFGDAMYRFQALTGPPLSQTTNAADLPYLNQSRMTYLLMIPRTMLLANDGRWMIAMALAAVIGGVAFPRRVGLMTFWFVSVYGLFTVVGGTLRPGSPNIRLDVTRYWIAFLPPVVIAAVGTVSVIMGLLVTRLAGPPEAATSPARRRMVTAGAAVAAVALVVVPVVRSADQVRHNPAFVAVNGNELSQFRTWLHEHDSSVGVTYTDWMAGRILPTYKYSFTGRRLSSARFVSLGQYSHASVGDHVVLVSQHSGMCYFCSPITAAFLAVTPQVRRNWTQEWRSSHGNVVVYRIDRVTRPVR